MLSRVLAWIPSSPPYWVQNGRSYYKGSFFWTCECADTNTNDDCFSYRTGITVMLHLLIDTSIFVSLPNGCLCQMTGEPLNVPRGGIHAVIEENTKKFLKRASSSLENIESGPPSKRRKLGLGKPTRATAPILKIKTWVIQTNQRVFVCWTSQTGLPLFPSFAWGCFMHVLTAYQGLVKSSLVFL